MELEKKCVNYSVLKFLLCLKKSWLDLVIFWVNIDENLNRAQKNDKVQPWFFLQSMNFNTL